jgi:hypothetical protein
MLLTVIPIASANDEKNIDDRSMYTIESTFLDSYAEHKWGYGREPGIGHGMSDGDYFNLYLNWSPSSGVSFKVGLYDYVAQEVVTSSLESPIKAGYTRIDVDTDGTYCIAIVNQGSTTTTYSGFYYVVN